MTRQYNFYSVADFDRDFQKFNIKTVIKAKTACGLKKSNGLLWDEKNYRQATDFFIQDEVGNCTTISNKYWEQFQANEGEINSMTLVSNFEFIYQSNPKT